MRTISSPTLLSRVRQRLRPGAVRRAQLRSSALQEAAYDPRRRLLELRFASGRVYQYGSVDPACWEQLLRAPSAGRYFNQHIRRGPGYPMRPAEAPELLPASKRD